MVRKLAGILLAASMGAAAVHGGVTNMTQETAGPASGGGAVRQRLATNETPFVTNETVLATFAGGCFWCTEAVFQRVKGVVSVRSGYTGGKKENPTYKDVCSGKTGHAEAVEVRFDPKVVTYRELLDLFWKMHDPTTLNRQGEDIGTQYRSAIFYHGEGQKADAEASRDELDKSKAFASPIVTEIVPAATFYPAEDYHQNYFNSNREAGYCRMVIAPKLKKMGMNETTEGVLSPGPRRKR
jgi:peptide-methionine (S)-S-oxide reductase